MWYKDENLTIGEFSIPLVVYRHLFQLWWPRNHSFSSECSLRVLVQDHHKKTTLYFQSNSQIYQLLSGQAFRNNGHLLQHLYTISISIVLKISAPQETYCNTELNLMQSSWWRVEYRKFNIIKSIIVIEFYGVAYLQALLNLSCGNVHLTSIFF